MKKIILLASITLYGCVASSVSPNLDRRLSPDAKRLVTQSDFTITTETRRLSPPFSGFQCFEPLLYVLSFGIIPSHCKETYLLRATVELDGKREEIERPFEVTTMQGWLMLFLPMSPNWDFGENKDAVQRAQNTIINSLAK